MEENINQEAGGDDSLFGSIIKSIVGKSDDDATTSDSGDTSENDDDLTGGDNATDTQGATGEGDSELPKKKFKLTPKEKPADTSSQSATSDDDFIKAVEKPEGDGTPEGLTSEEMQIWEVAKFAESKNDANKGLSKKFEDFFASVREEQKRISEEDGDDVGLDDERMIRFIQKNKPRVDLRAYERDMIEDRVSSRVKKEVERVEQTFSRRLSRVERARDAAQERKKLGHSLISAVPDDVIPNWKDKGVEWKDLKAQHPLEVEVVDKVINGASDLGEALVDLEMGMVDFDEHNQMHNAVIQYIEAKTEQIKKAGGKWNGKPFVDKLTYWTRIKPEARHKYSTLTKDDLVKMLSEDTRALIANQVKAERERIEKMGFARKQTTTANTEQTQQTTQAVKEPATPKPPASAPKVETKDSGTKPNLASVFFGS